MAVDEAVRGVGVLMGRSPLLDSQIGSGALAVPFAERVKSARWLVLAGRRTIRRQQRLQVDHGSPAGAIAALKTSK